VNVPLFPGTSAHVIGATLVTLVVGPARAIVALTAVLFVQALLLGDGGITVLGINVLDLAVLPALSVAFVTRIAGRSSAALSTSAVAGTVLGNVAGASLLAAVLVGGAGVSARSAFPWLVGVHALTGVAEGVLTALAVRHLERRAPGLVSGTPDALALTAVERDERAKTGFRTAMGWTAVAVGVATALLPLASRAPDALEHLVVRNSVEH
jgi:cobalt/nickel transport system permease protein